MSITSCIPPNRHSLLLYRLTAEKSQAKSYLVVYA